ncbi:hypothetical protein NYO67_11565 [Aspergillus flavus]|nr:hypothetical protein NYO67_11565 [Aspergillus flavus]
MTSTIVALPEKSYLSLDPILRVQEEELFAQVTVFDGDHGDCNLIDLRQRGPSGNGTAGGNTGQWRRVLIDTGFNRARQVIANQVVEQLKTRAVPLFAPGEPEVPPLREMQITHFDNDHIGNAGAIMSKLAPSIKAWREKDEYYKCELVMNSVPAAWPNLQVEFSDIEPVGEGYKVTFSIQGIVDWATELEKHEFHAHQDAAYRISAKRPISPSTSSDPNSATAPANSIFAIESDKDIPIQMSTTDSRVEIPMTATDIKQILEAYSSRQKIPNLRLRVDLSVIWGDTSAEDSLNKNNSLEYEFELDFTEYIAPMILPRLSVTNQTKNQKWFKDVLTRCRRRTKKGKPPKIELPHKKVYKESLGSLMKAVQAINTEPPQGGDLVEHILPKVDTKPSRIQGEHITSPPASIQRQAVKMMLLKMYSKDQNVENEDKDDDDYFFGSFNKTTLINRASVVTVFSHFQFPMKMLFTGDAFDQACDLGRTTAAWSGRAINETYDFDVLKIPHHGSNMTADSKFYQQFRADVYIICGAHYKHGNPKYSSIRAIVDGFHNRQRKSGEPYRLFFSDPKADQDTDNYKSAIRRVFQSGEKPNGSSYKYEAYKLKARKADDVDDVPWGSIVFYWDKAGHMRETWSNTEWERILVN